MCRHPGLTDSRPGHLSIIRIEVEAGAIFTDGLFNRECVYVEEQRSEHRALENAVVGWGWVGEKRQMCRTAERLVESNVTTYVPTIKVEKCGQWRASWGRTRLLYKSA